MLSPCSLSYILMLYPMYDTVQKVVHFNEIFQPKFYVQSLLPQHVLQPQHSRFNDSI